MRQADYNVYQLRQRYIILLATIWVAVLSTLFSLFIEHEIDQLETDYLETHEAIQRFTSDAVKVNEVAIESFASFIAAYSGPDPTVIRTFAQQLRKHYPDIYMLEIATRVTHSDRQKLRAQMRKLGYSNFNIHTFSYEADRTSKISPEKEAYYPIVFIEPEMKSAMGVLGLDLSDSSSILKDALSRSFHQQTHIASRPFDLMEGGRGYLLYREVRNDRATIPFLELSPGKARYALLVFRANRLLPEWINQRGGWAVSLEYPVADENSMLVSIDNTHNEDNSWQNTFLPVFTRSSKLGSESQAFVLTTRYPVLWSNFDLSLIMTFILMLAILSPLGLWLSLTLYRRKVRDIEQQERHYHLANYDPLTGLPNKMLAEELFEQAKKLRDRKQKPLGILYIDINRFKQINDAYGHAAGDLLLEEAAKRMRNALRESDTLARLHGDEFVVFLNEIEEQGDIKVVTRHLKEAFKVPFDYQDKALQVGLSIGSSLYPEDGRSFDSLLAAADKEMYRDKHPMSSATVTPIR